MSRKVTPCLWFDNNGAEAAQFYVSVFPNSSIKSSGGPMTTIMLDGNEILLLDGWSMYQKNPSISLYVKCRTKEEIDAIWSKLMDGGIAMMELQEYPWSKYYGWCQDKYGMTWQVILYEQWELGQSIVPSLLFTQDKFGKGEEALTFYTKLFKNSAIDRIAHIPAGDPNEGKMLYAEFHLEDSHLVAMDGPGDHKFTFSEGISLSVQCDGQEEVDYFWNALTADGGEESQCSWLKDRFGISWQIVPVQLMAALGDSDPAKAQYAMQQMLQMRKIVIADLYQK